MRLRLSCASVLYNIPFLHSTALFWTVGGITGWA